MGAGPVETLSHMLHCPRKQAAFLGNEMVLAAWQARVAVLTALFQ